MNPRENIKKISKNFTNIFSTEIVTKIVALSQTRIFAEFTADIQHIAGKANPLADALSRALPPVPASNFAASFSPPTKVFFSCPTCTSRRPRLLG